MALKYLNDQKLRYFWSKVKTILANKADKGHKHTKSEITDFAHTHAVGNITGGIANVLAGYDATGKLKSVNVDGNTVESAFAGYDVAYGIQEQLDGKYSASNPPPYPVSKVNNKTGTVVLNHNDVGAVQNGGVRGQDGNHKMGVSWDGSHVIVGVDNNAAVKTLVDTGMVDVTRIDWTFPTTSANFIVDGTKPWITGFKRQGSMVTFVLDVTTKYQLKAGTAWPVIYNIDARFKPKYLWKQSIITSANKRVFLELVQDAKYNLCVKISGDTVDAFDRITMTLTYMI